MSGVNIRLRRQASALLLAFSIECLPAAEGFPRGIGPDLPSITVSCRDVTLLLRQASQWTPGRIDFRGVAMTTERSAYGTVFSFPGTGFVGTAHLENEPENLQSLAFSLDGKPVETPAAQLEGRAFRFERRSRVRGFDLTCVTEIQNNQLHETTTVHAREAVALQLVYHFMHAWAPSVSAFLAGNDATRDQVISGPLHDGGDMARKFFINQRVDWTAVYEPKSGQFAVSRLLAAPEQGGHVSMIWNVPGSYRKFYLKCFENQTVPADFTGTWRMITAFDSGTPDNWKKTASALAARLRG